MSNREMALWLIDNSNKLNNNVNRLVHGNILLIDGWGPSSGPGAAARCQQLSRMMPLINRVPLSCIVVPLFEGDNITTCFCSYFRNLHHVFSYPFIPACVML